MVQIFILPEILLFQMISNYQLMPVLCCTAFTQMNAGRQVLPGILRPPLHSVTVTGNLR